MKKSDITHTSLIEDYGYIRYCFMMGFDVEDLMVTLGLSYKIEMVLSVMEKDGKRLTIYDNNKRISYIESDTGFRVINYRDSDGFLMKRDIVSSQKYVIFKWLEDKVGNNVIYFLNSGESNQHNIVTFNSDGKRIGQCSYTDSNFNVEEFFKRKKKRDLSIMDKMIDSL